MNDFMKKNIRQSKRHNTVRGNVDQKILEANEIVESYTLEQQSRPKRKGSNTDVMRSKKKRKASNDSNLNNQYQPKQDFDPNEYFAEMDKTKTDKKEIKTNFQTTKIGGRDIFGKNTSTNEKPLKFIYNDKGYETKVETFKSKKSTGDGKTKTTTVTSKKYVLYERDEDDKNNTKGKDLGTIVNEQLNNVMTFLGEVDDKSKIKLNLDDQKQIEKELKKYGSTTKEIEKTSKEGGIQIKKNGKKKMKEESESESDKEESESKSDKEKETNKEEKESEKEEKESDKEEKDSEKEEKSPEKKVSESESESEKKEKKEKKKKEKKEPKKKEKKETKKKEKNESEKEKKDPQKESEKKTKTTTTITTDKQKDDEKQSCGGNGQYDYQVLFKQMENNLKIIEEKNKTIEKLEKKIKSLEGDNEDKGKYISVHFISSTDERIDNSFVGRINEPFSRVEEKLYSEFPDLIEIENNNFEVNGKKVYRFKTLKENGITKDGTKVTFVGSEVGDDDDNE